MQLVLCFLQSKQYFTKLVLLCQAWLSYKSEMSLRGVFSTTDDLKFIGLLSVFSSPLPGRKSIVPHVCSGNFTGREAAELGKAIDCWVEVDPLSSMKC